MGPKSEGPNMPKVVTKLNDTQIKSTKPDDKEVNLFDGDGLFFAHIANRERWQEKLVLQVCGSCD